MANELAIAMRDAGTELAETFANRDSSGSRTRYGTVMANNGATLDVELAGGSVSGVPMTTACVGARAGDRVLLTVDGPLITATGILATADNGPYVLRSGSYYLGSVAAQMSRLIHINLDMPSADYAVAVSNASGVSFWTKMRFSLWGAPRKDGFDVLCYNDDSTMPVSDAYFRWVALWTRQAG